MNESNFVNPYEQIWKTRDLSSLDAPVEVENNMSSFRRGLGRFGKQMEAVGYALPALGAQAVENVIGENEVTSGITDWGLEGYKKATEESESGIYAPTVPNIESIKNASDAFSWAGGILGEQLPLVAGMALTAGVGGLVARAGAGAVSGIAKAAVGKVVEKGVEKGALRAAAGQLITQELKDTAAKELLKTTIRGATAGAFAGTAGLEGGLAFGEQVGQGVDPAEAVKSAIAVGGINGALELVTPYVVAKRIGLGEYARQSIKKIIETNPDLSKRAIALAAEVGSRAARGAVEGALTEGLTESLQELTSIAGERWAKSDPLFEQLTDADWSRVKNSAVAGAFVGGALGGAGATLGGPSEKQDSSGGNGSVQPAPKQEGKVKTPEEKIQELEKIKVNLGATLEAAKAEGDVEKAAEIQSVVDLYDNAINETKAQIEAAKEAPVIETSVPEIPITEAPVSETPVSEAPVSEAPVITQPPTTETPATLDNTITPLSPAEHWDTADQVTRRQWLKDVGTSDDYADRKSAEWGAWDQIPDGKTKNDLGALGKVTQEAPQEEVISQESSAPAPGETIQLKRGEEIILTPGAAPTTRVTPTQEEVDALQQRMGPRPEKQSILSTEEVAKQEPLYSRPLENPKAPIFYSGLERALQDVKQERASFPQWEGTLNSLVKNGVVKKEELEWSETKEWLKEQKGPVTKEALLQHVRDNTLEVKEVDVTPRNTKWTEPGAANQRELVLTVPSIKSFSTDDATHYGDVGGGRAVAWVRFNDRVDGDGNKTLFLEEVQSKRHQDGKSTGYAVPAPPYEVRLATEDEIKKYKPNYAHRQWWAAVDKTTQEIIGLDEFKHSAENIAKQRAKRGVPDAPFKQEISGSNQTLSGWAGLVFKRMLRYAVENGYDRVAFTNGEQQSKRYKGAGDKFLRRLYDETIPNELNKYVKKWGAKVDQTQMQFGNESANVPSIEITPAMRDSVMQGQPLYSKPKEKIVTPEMDAEYLAAVERGDMEAAQRMVDKAAKKVGVLSFDEEYPTYSSMVNGVKNGELLVHARELGEGAGYDFQYGLDPTIGKTLGATEAIQTMQEYEIEPVELVFASDGFRWVGKGRNGMIFVRKDGFQKSLGDGKVQLPDGSVIIYEKSPIADHENEALRAEPAGVETGDWYSTKTANVVGVSPFNEKSADTVTRDDSGNIIPLSQRFNSSNSDVRYTSQPDIVTIPLQGFHSNINSTMGEGWLQKAIDLKLVEVIEGPGPNGESGSWVGDKIRLYTGSMPKNGSPAGVLLHEGKHHTFDEVLGDSLPEYVKDLHTLATNGNKIARDAIAHAAIITADLLGIKHNLRENGNKSDLDAIRALIEQRRPGLLAEEELAYFVQYGVDAQTGVGFWKRLVNQIKAWFAQTRLGQRMKELGLGFELTDGMAVEWAKMGLNRTIAKLKQEAQVREQVLKEAANMPVSERLGRAVAALEQIDPLYSFLGNHALTANLSKLDEAIFRLNNWEDKDTIRKETGWFLNEADGKWRFEIDDSKANWVTPFENIEESELFEKEIAYPLKDVLDHPELFEAYPQLEKISIIKREGFRDFKNQLQGEFNDDNLQILITPYATDPMSTLLHELQHVIQMYEGFARGGNEDSVWNELPKETKENIAKNILEKLKKKSTKNQETLNFLSKIENSPKIKSYLDQYGAEELELKMLLHEKENFYEGTDRFKEANAAVSEAYAQLEETKKSIARLLGISELHKLNEQDYLIVIRIARGEAINNIQNEIHKELVNLLAKKSKVQVGDEKAIVKEANLYEFYKRLAGETEARLTQARQNMSMQERNEKSPESMQEYPYDQQIVVRQGKSTEGEILYSMGIREISEQLWNDPTDPNQEIVNKPGLLQKFRLSFIDFFAEMEKKSKGVYNAYSLLRSKKAARIEQARQEYYLPLRALIANSPWTAEEVGDMLAARHISIDKVNRKLAERASSEFILDLAKNLTNARRTALLEGRKNILAGKMPNGGQYLNANGQPAAMASSTMRQLMFNLMDAYAVQEQPDPSGRQIIKEEWELFKDAAAGFSDGGVGSTKVRKVSDVLNMANRDRAKFTEIANLFDGMNRHVLDILEQGKLITAPEHARLLLDKSAYAPLRRESYKFDKAVDDLFRGTGQGGSKQVSVRTGTAALSEPTLVLQNALAKVEAAAAAAERNLANTELYEVIVKDKAGWKPWFSIVDKDVYVTHDEHGFLSEKNATGTSRADIVLIHKGKRLLIRPNMHNGRATGFVRAVNNLDAQTLSGPMKVLSGVNQLVRAVNITFSPVFLMRNAIMDPFTAAYNIQASEAAKHTGAIFSNYGRAFKMLKKVFLDGNRDPNDPDVKWVEEWENAGGRASFIDSLKQMDDTWSSFDAQVARRQGSMKYLMKIKDTWIDGIENFNLLFENVMRFSTFLTLVENNVVDKARAARISQDLTTNYTRRGYQTQMLGTWWLFFNASVQGSYQVVRNLISSPRLLKWSAATVGMAVMLDLLGRELYPDDWDKIPEWDKDRYIIVPVKIGGDFIKIPSPWVYNTLWRMGGMMGEVIAGKRKIQDFAIDTAALTATSFSPLGKPGSIAQFISPTAADPFIQILENKDFSGNPIGPEGYPGASKKANSELLWGSTPKGYQTVARFVNEATGGSPAEPGVVDLKPGDYQLLAQFLTGSLGRFLSDTTFGFTQNLEKGIEGPKDIPIIKEFFSDPYDPMNVQKYHTNIASIYGAHRLEQMYLKGPDRDLIKLHEVRQERGEELRMFVQAQDVERQLKSLRVRLRAAQKRGDNTREKEIKNKMEKVQERFNIRYQQRIG